LTISNLSDLRSGCYELFGASGYALEKVDNYAHSEHRAVRKFIAFDFFLLSSQHVSDEKRLSGQGPC